MPQLSIIFREEGRLMNDEREQHDAVDKTVIEATDL